jgi:CheY-like chemotaxis protein
VAPADRRTTILVVEDDRALRQFYRDTLVAVGYAVVAVEDGMDALRWLEQGMVPQAIVLDIGLPRLSGRDVHQELKAHGRRRPIPIVVVSGTDISSLDPSEFACVLQKPVTSKALLEAVEKCLR